MAAVGFGEADIIGRYGDVVLLSCLAVSSRFTHLFSNFMFVCFTSVTCVCVFLFQNTKYDILIIIQNFASF